MDRAVLRIHREDLRPRRRASPTYHWRARYERLLVGEGEALPALERSDRHVQPGKANHPVEHDVDITLVGERCEGTGAAAKLGARRQPAIHLARSRGVRQRDDAGPELSGLRHEKVD
jgi:hypothetical protein